MAPLSQVEQILGLARALYQRGAVPEALAIAREVFVSLWGRDDLAELLPEWIRSLGPGEAGPPPLGTGAALGNAIELLEPALDPAGSIRALTNICAVRPIAGAALAERVIRALHSYEHASGRQWKEIPIAFRSPAFGWEIALPVLTAARRQGLVVPADFTREMVQRLPQRIRNPLSPADIELVNDHARHLREQGDEEPGIRLAVACAVTASAPVPMAQVIEIVQPSQQIRQAAELFDRRGYPTEAASLLIDSIEGLPAERELHQLMQRIEQFLARPSTQSSRSRRQRSKPPATSPPDEASIAVPSPAPGSPPPKPPKKPESKPGKSFFFVLDGEHAHKDQVVRNQAADLYFLYDVPSPGALARLESNTLGALANAAREGDTIEIGVFIKPFGLTFRGNEVEYKIARIKNDELQEKVFFKLRAKDEPLADSGLHVVLTYNGAEVFQAFIRIAIVETLDATSPSVTQLVISKSTFDLNQALPRDITAFITTQDGQCRVSVRVGSELPKPPEVFDLLQLQNAISNARTKLSTVAETPAFRMLTPGRWGADSGQEAEFLGALCRMMSAGSTLHKFLRDSQATRGLVEAIEALDTGAKITIFTDSAFVPWEIVFPRHFFSDDRLVKPDATPPGFEPGLLWGNRFEFETVLVFSNRSQSVQHPLPSERRQPGTLNIRMGIGSVEPDPEPGTAPADAALNAIVHHRAYCDDHPSVAHWLDGPKALKQAFDDPDYDVSLLYLMCHGKSTGTSEELDFGGYKPLPEWLNPERVYPGWPIVFINSCSIASAGPHVFDTFLRRFREKQAFGLIASSFPLPTRFATLFGCQFLEGYRGGARVGHLLLTMRQRLLKERNPLAFFYALQCPLDVQRPDKPRDP